MEQPNDFLACPFCGFYEIQILPLGDGTFTADCHACGAGTGANGTEADAKAKWNRRAGVPEHGVTQELRLAPANWLDARAVRREELWARAYGGAAESKCDITRQMATMIADCALRAFDERFGASSLKEAIRQRIDVRLASHEHTEEDKIQHGPHGTTYSL